MVGNYPTPRGMLHFLKLLTRTIKQFNDIPLALTIGYFIVTISGKLNKIHLPTLLHHLECSPRPQARDPYSGLERISRLRQPWLWLPILKARNTCYVRAMTLYRFLDSGDGDLRIHFGVEPPRQPDDRVRGHAWVTVDGKVLEESEVLDRNVHEIYVYPPT
jgi:Transglutaminase-like superfamily